MSGLPTFKMKAGQAKEILLAQVTQTDLSTDYDSVEFRSEDAGLTLSSTQATELVLENGGRDVRLKMPSFPDKDRRYAYWLAGISGPVTTDLGGMGYFVIREEP